MDLTPEQQKYGDIAMAARRLGFKCTVEAIEQETIIRWVDLVDGPSIIGEFRASTKKQAFILACDFLVDHVAIKPPATEGS